MQKNSLTKTERLCGKTKIEKLFTAGQSFVVFPYRIVYTVLENVGSESGAAVFVSVPKKKFKHAVKRNLIRRRVKEAYRLNKSGLNEYLSDQKISLAIAFLYIDKEEGEYSLLDKKMIEMLSRLKLSLQARQRPEVVVSE